MKPTTDEVLKRIQELAPEERLRLISELEKQKEELGHMATIEQLTDVLSQFGLVETKPKVLEVRNRSKRGVRA